MRREMKSRCVRTLALTALMLSVAVFSPVRYGTLGAVGDAHAGFTVIPTATAHAHGLAASVSGSLLNVNVAPTPASNCISGPFCVDVHPLATAEVTGVLKTGVLNTAAVSTTNFTAATAIGQANVANPLLNVLGLISLNALAVDSFALVGGGCFAGLAQVGASGLVNATTSGLLSLLISPSAGPNTVVLDLLGIRIVANEQIVVGDFFSNLKLTVNPLHISINNLLGLGLLSADITLAQSEAKVTCAVR